MNFINFNYQKKQQHLSRIFDYFRDLDSECTEIRLEKTYLKWKQNKTEIMEKLKHKSFLQMTYKTYADFLRAGKPPLEARRLARAMTTIT